MPVHTGVAHTDDASRLGPLWDVAPRVTGVFIPGSRVEVQILMELYLPVPGFFTFSRNEFSFV